MPTPASSDAITLIESAFIDQSSFQTLYSARAATEAACVACPNYGKSWSCPPLGKNLTDSYASFRKVKLYVARIPVAPATPISESARLLAPAKKRLLTHLREIEERTQGRICGLAGVCELCSDEGCTRPAGLPCRYPEKVRPSLEALGYDVGKAVKGLTGLDILWGKDGYLPEYLLLVGALFANQ